MGAPEWLPAQARIVVASANPGKLREIREILADRGLDLCDLVSASAGSAISFPEEGGDYAANAVAKARAVALQLGLCALADDSGLEVDALAGAPGPYSARFGGPGLDDSGRVRQLLDALSHAGASSAERRRARFVCWVALVSPQGDLATAFGECAGVILSEPRGSRGFGYDPVFQPEGFGESMAQLSDEAKNRISHRARALRALFGSGSPQAAVGVTPRAGRGVP